MRQKVRTWLALLPDEYRVELPRPEDPSSRETCAVSIGEHRPQSQAANTAFGNLISKYHRVAVLNL